MTVGQSLLSEIVNRVRGVASPERIILFGSSASGQTTPDSDVDLLVLEPSVEDARDERVRIAQALRGLGCPFDVIIMSTERFEESKDVIGGIAFPANKYGTVIYEAS